MGEIQRRIDEANAVLADASPARRAASAPRCAVALQPRSRCSSRQRYAQVERRGATHRGVPRAVRAEEGDALTGPPRAQGVLTEWPCEHPTLPVRGVIDLVRRTVEGTRRGLQDGHAASRVREQLLAVRAAVVASTGDLPVSIAVQRPDGATTFGGCAHGWRPWRPRCLRASTPRSGGDADPRAGARCGRVHRVRLRCPRVLRRVHCARRRWRRGGGNECAPAAPSAPPNCAGVSVGGWQGETEKTAGSAAGVPWVRAS